MRLTVLLMALSVVGAGYGAGGSAYYDRSHDGYA